MSEYNKGVHSDFSTYFPVVLDCQRFIAASLLMFSKNIFSAMHWHYVNNAEMNLTLRTGRLDLELYHMI
ncbi:TPA: hypothetical protein H2C15_000925 [Salmonella enterica]|nr:hypothetical protein [Salmonella enterica]ELS4052261.1 hypothetical protein [Salmonella enterica]HAK4774734.1 hypothetical protein [Salmonella enterica]